MTAVFCLRLALGMAAALILLSPTQVNPRFYRVQFQVVLGLTAVAALFLQPSGASGPDLWSALGSTALLAFVGSVVWSLDKAPAGRTVAVLTTVASGIALCLAAPVTLPEVEPAWLLPAEISSALVVGLAMTAMLMGHSYLIAPAMSIVPLLRLLAALGVAVLLRMAVAGAGLVSWSADHSLATLNDVTVVLPARWLLGFVVPVVLGVMAWQAARIRATQSATGILYAAVFSCFVGELSGLFLLSATRLPL